MKKINGPEVIIHRPDGSVKELSVFETQLECQTIPGAFLTWTKTSRVFRNSRLVGIFHRWGYSPRQVDIWTTKEITKGG